MTTSNVSNTTNTTVSSNVESVIQGINFYTINFAISAWTSERNIAPEEMEKFAQNGVPTPVLDAIRDGKLGKGKILTYDKEALKVFDAFRGRIRDKLRDLHSFPYLGGSYIFCDEQKYREALDFIKSQEPEYWEKFQYFKDHYDEVLEKYIRANPQHEVIIRQKIIPKELVMTKFSYRFISFENILPAQGKERFYEVIFDSLMDTVRKKANEALTNKVGLRGLKTMVQYIEDICTEFKPVAAEKLDKLISECQNVLDSVDAIPVSDRKKRFSEICGNLADENWLDSIMEGTKPTAQEPAPEQKAEATNVQTPVVTGWQNSMW
jgi:hypothetical protein